MVDETITTDAPEAEGAPTASTWGAEDIGGGSSRNPDPKVLKVKNRSPLGTKIVRTVLSYPRWAVRFPFKFVTPMADFTWHARWNVWQFDTFKSNSIVKHAGDLDHSLLRAGLNYIPEHSLSLTEGLANLEGAINNFTSDSGGKIDAAKAEIDTLIHKLDGVLNKYTEAAEARTFKANVDSAVETVKTKVGPGTKTFGQVSTTIDTALGDIETKAKRLPEISEKLNIGATSEDNLLASIAKRCEERLAEAKREVDDLELSASRTTEFESNPDGAAKALEEAKAQKELLLASEILNNFAAALEDIAKDVDDTFVKPAFAELTEITTNDRMSVTTAVTAANKDLDRINQAIQDIDKTVGITRNNIDNITKRKSDPLTGRNIDPSTGKEAKNAAPLTNSTLFAGSGVEKKAAFKTEAGIQTVAELNGDVLQRVGTTVDTLREAEAQINEVFDGVPDDLITRPNAEIESNLEQLKRALKRQAEKLGDMDAPLDMDVLPGKFEHAKAELKQACKHAKRAMRDTMWLSPVGIPFTPVFIHRLAVERDVGVIGEKSSLFDLLRGRTSISDYANDKNPLKPFKLKPTYRRDIERVWGWVERRTAKTGSKNPEEIFNTQVLINIREGMKAGDRDGVLDALQHLAYSYGAGAERDKGIPDFFVAKLRDLKVKGELDEYLIDDEMVDLIDHMRRQQVNFANSVRRGIANYQDYGVGARYWADSLSESVDPGKTEIGIWAWITRVATQTLTWPVYKAFSSSSQWMEGWLDKEEGVLGSRVPFISKLKSPATLLGGIMLLPITVPFPAYLAEEAKELVTWQDSDADIAQRIVKAGITPVWNTGSDVIDWTTGWRIPEITSETFTPGPSVLGITPFGDREDPTFVLDPGNITEAFGLFGGGSEKKGKDSAPKLDIATSDGLAEVFVDQLKLKTGGDLDGDGDVNENDTKLETYFVQRLTTAFDDNAELAARMRSGIESKTLKPHEIIEELDKATGGDFDNNSTLDDVDRSIKAHLANAIGAIMPAEFGERDPDRPSRYDLHGEFNNNATSGEDPSAEIMPPPEEPEREGRYQLNPH